MERQEFDLSDYSLEVKDGKAVLKRKRKWKWRECKAGDFICFGDDCIGIYNQKSNNVGKFRTRCFLDKDKFTSYCSEHPYTNVRLASKEEKKRLLAAIDKGGFIWDSENLTMKKKYEFDDGVFVADADGDLFIHWKTGDSDFSHGSYVYWNRESDDIVLGGAWNMTTGTRYATNEEMEALNARLAKKGLEWDSKNKRLRKKRWRAAKHVLEKKGGKEPYGFKPGDVLTGKVGQVVIFAGVYERGIVTYCGYRRDVSHFTDRKGLGWGLICEFDYASEEQKAMLFGEIEKRGYVWDAEKLELRKKRWRAKKNEKYWVINVLCCAVPCFEEGHSCDTRCYKVGNYFRTKEQAEKVAEEIRKIFEKDREE